MSVDRARADTSARITRATFSLLAEHGLAGVTMSAIANRAGIARQTLYNHFPDVDSIVAAAMAQHHHDDLQALDAMLATIPAATGRLDHLVRHASVAAAEHGAMPALHQGLSPSAQHAAREYDEQIRGMIRDALVRGQQTGELAPTIDPDLHAVLVHHLLDAAAELAAARPDEVAHITETTIGLIHSATRSAP